MLLSIARDRLPLVGRAGLAWLFPPNCPFCGQPDCSLCPHCEKELRSAQWQPISRQLPHLAGLIASGRHHGFLREAIRALKYGCERVVAAPLGERLWQLLQQRGEPAGFDAIIPVPLHETRLLERGFNQAEWLASRLSERSGIPLQNDGLRRARETQSQVGLDEQQRKRNVAEAFQASDGLAGRRILLVDDVCTSGATLVACAQVLRRTGAAAVSAITVSTSLPQEMRSETNVAQQRP